MAGIVESARALLRRFEGPFDPRPDALRHCAGRTASWTLGEVGYRILVANPHRPSGQVACR